MSDDLSCSMIVRSLHRSSRALSVSFPITLTSPAHNKIFSTKKPHLHIASFHLSIPNLINMTSTPEWTVEAAIPDHIKEILTPKENGKINYVLVFLQIVSLLKSQKRTGWVDHGINDCESIADHMYRMGVSTLLITDPKVDTGKCTKIALIHDIAESLVGDITPFDPVTKEEKHRREYDTILYLSNLVKKYDEKAGEEILQYWLDYEEIRTLEARYVKDIDKFEMLVQSFEYEKKFKGEKKLDQFWSARSSIKTDEVKSWVDELWARRTEFWNEINKR